MGVIGVFYNSSSYNPHFYNLQDVRQTDNIFYEHINGGGSSFPLRTGSSIASISHIWNDQISSVSVAPRTLVLLFEHPNFRGSTKLLENYGTTPAFYNINNDFNDAASSIRTYPLC
jgi:hypothetical protein